MQIEVTANGFVGITSADGQYDLHFVSGSPDRDIWGHTCLWRWNWGTPRRAFTVLFDTRLGGSNDN